MILPSRRAAARASTRPIPLSMQGVGFLGFGLGGPSQPSHELLLREVAGPNATATRAIAARLSQLELLVQVDRRVADGTVESETLDDHPLAMLFARPHPNFSMPQLLRLIGHWLATTGDAYLLKVGSGLGVPTELHPVPPSRVSVQVGAGGVVESYGIAASDGAVRTIAANAMVRVFLPDPEDPWRSQGYLASSGAYADALRFASEHIRRHFQRDATPRAVLEAQPDAAPFDESALAAMMEQWRAAFDARSGGRVGLPAVTPPRYKLVTVAAQSGAEVVPLLEFLRDEQLMAYGVPRSVLGQVVSGDRSSAETNQWVFDRYAIAPLASLIEDALTTHLAVDFDAALRVRFAPFVSEDKAFNLQQEQSDLEHAVRTPNMVRKERGLDPVPWGDDPIISSSLGRYDPDRMRTASVPEAVPVALDEDDDPRVAERAAHAAIRRLARHPARHAARRPLTSVEGGPW